MSHNSKHKIVIKVINEDRLEWATFCYVPQEVFKEFSRWTNLKVLDFNAYLSLWAKEDFLINLDMATLKDVETLKRIVYTSCRQSYNELYQFERYGLTINRGFWLKYWVTSHLKVETEIIKKMVL